MSYGLCCQYYREAVNLFLLLYSRTYHTFDRLYSIIRNSEAKIGAKSGITQSIVRHCMLVAGISGGNAEHALCACM